MNNLTWQQELVLLLLQGKIDFETYTAAVEKYAQPGTSYAYPLGSSWALSSVVAEICERAGVPLNRLNLSNLEGYVDGFSINNAYAAYTGIEALGRIFLFDHGNYDGRLNFVKRGGESIANLTINDLIDDGSNIEQTIKKDAISVPRVMHLEYYDVEGGLSPDKQTSDRSLDARSTAELKTNTTVTLRTADAARTLSINHKIAIEDQRGGIEFALPDSFIFLSPGDVVTLDGERLRIIEVEIEQGLQKYKTIYDRQSAYSSFVDGIPAAAPIDPPTLIVGDTVLHFIDSHILRDADDRLGYYVAINGASDAWFGATVEISTDGGLNYSESIDAQTNNTIGLLSDPLPAHSRDYPDNINSLNVTLLRSDMDLESTDLRGMLNRTNLALVGDEIVNFSSATEISPQVWRLDNLLRGRKGSTIATHSQGTRFILLDRPSLFFINAELFEINRTLTFRATTFGASSSVVSSGLFSARCQKERQPAYLRAFRSGGGVEIFWQGVGRLGGGVSINMGQYFAGYRVTINGVSQDTPNQNLMILDPGGALTIQVEQINALTGPGPIAQVML